MPAFVGVVGAYMDVIRDEAIVGLNKENVKVLEVNLQAAKDRFQVGDLTRTDVAQSDARLSVARPDVAGCRSRDITCEGAGAPGSHYTPAPDRRAVGAATPVRWKEFCGAARWSGR